MDPYSSPYIIPNNGPRNPFPHSLLSTRELITVPSCTGQKQGLGTLILGFQILVLWVGQAV